MPEPDSAPAKTASWPVKAFVFFHLFCITVWSLPTPPDSLMTGRAKPVGSDPLLIWNQRTLKSLPPVVTYLSVTGLWQYWDMFAPNPSQTDLWGDAEVEFRDGTTRHYQYPRMALLSVPDKMPRERFRKFYERASQDQFKYLWPQFGLRIAILNDNPSNPPVKVRLTRHWQQISPPGQMQATDYKKFTYFEYAVDQKKLAAARGAK